MLSEMPEDDWNEEPPTRESSVVVQSSRERAVEDWRQRTAWYLRQVGVPGIFCDKTWADFQLVAGKTQALREARQWCHSRCAGGGLLFTGPVGAGKSLLAALCVRDWLRDGRSWHMSDSPRRWYDRGGEEAWEPGILWTSVSDLLRGVRYRCFDLKQSSEDREMSALRTVPLLVLDDIGVRALSEWGHDFLLAAVDDRYSESCTTIVTSNLDLAGLARVLEERISSRLAGMCRVVEVGGEDMRRKGRG